MTSFYKRVNPLNAELNPICRLLALLEAHHIFQVSRIRVNEPSRSTKCSDIGDYLTNCWFVKDSVRWSYLVTNIDAYCAMQTTLDLAVPHYAVS